ncbi:MAG: hypothetical protein KY397_03220, partial [Gemmatimonadetes bacterium]|nr:hypothetical protein [Gemmatimonadota bacterium]
GLGHGGGRGGDEQEQRSQQRRTMVTAHGSKLLPGRVGTVRESKGMRQEDGVGRGARLDGRGARVDAGDPAAARPIAVSGATDPAGAILATGFPFRSPDQLDRYLAAFRALFERVADMRRAGSAALDLAWTAAGRVDGFWEIGLSLWDFAAGELLVREAGGLVSGWDGGAGHRKTGTIAAGTPAVHALLVEVLEAWS